MESDRMGHLLPALTEAKLRIQKDVVKNEYRQNYANRPYGQVSRLLAEALYPPGHPYSWLTIGVMEDVEAATRADVEAFFQRFYVPSNASLCLVGDLDEDGALAQAERYFGPLAGGTEALARAVPRAELAEAAGLKVDNGIVVDATLATGDPDIFAAGDVCAFPGALGPLLRLEAWKNADVQGALAARNMLGANEPYREIPWFWSDQYELTLQIAGHPEHGTRAVERPVEGGRLFFHLDEAGRLVGVSSLGPAAIAKEAKLGQMMLERDASPDPALLADPKQKLKALLR
jgi:hypothetical protein